MQASYVDVVVFPDQRCGSGQIVSVHQAPIDRKSVTLST